MIKKHIAGLSSLAALLTVWSFSACTNADYDLDSIDKTIAAGTESAEGFRLPGNNSVREIQLSDMLDIDNSDVISTDEEGNYLFAKGAGSEDVKAAHPYVESIVVQRGSDRPSQNIIDLSPIDTIGQSYLNYLRQLAQAVDIDETYVKKSIGLFVDNFFNSMNEDYTIEDQLTLFTYEVELPDEVNELTELVARHANSASTIDINLTFSPDAQQLIDRVFSIDISLPSFLTRSVGRSQGLTDGTYVENRSEGIHLDVSTKGVAISLSANALRNFENHQPSFDVEAAKRQGGNYLKIVKRGSKQVLMLQADLHVDLKIHLKNIDKEVLKQHLTDRFYDRSRNYSMTSSVQLYDIEIAQATGKFNPDVDLTDGIGEIEINDLPDFLEDDDVKLVIDNPQLGFSVSSNVGVTGKLENLKLVTLGNVMANGQRERLDSVLLPALTILPHTGNVSSSTTTKYIIHDRGKTIQTTGQYQQYQDAVPVEPIGGSKTLAGLLEKIPKAITFECDASVDQNETGTFALGQRYTVQPSYDFWAPLAFNYGSIIVYRDTIDGWHDDLKDIRMTKGSYVVVEADVVNRVPADLKVRAYPMQKDASGKLVQMDAAQMEVVVTTPQNSKDGVVDAGTKDSPKTTHINVVVRQQGDSGLELLDGIIYRAEAFTPADAEYQGKALNKSQHTLRIENIVPTLHGKVVYNLDD
jgi:hypothetical protein